MKKFYLTVFLAGATLFSFAQSKIDLTGQATLKQYNYVEKLGDNFLLKADKGELSTIQPFANVPERVLVLVDLNLNADLTDLEAQGAVVRSQIDNLALVEVDADKVVEVSKLKSVKALSLPRKAKTLMDQARTEAGVNTVHRPLGKLPQAYKGAGVITGLVDAGVTANHPNFMKTDGTSRVKRVWTISGQDGVVTTYDTDYKLSQFTTDLSTMTHGTHVAGIMAGSYKNLADTINYYGVASEADIAMVGVGNDTYDNNLLLGIETIIKYAEEQGQPCVVNLSLGSGYGPHDGTELFSQYINKLAERAVICVAAGNEADLGMAISKTCTDADKNINTFVMPSYYKNGQMGVVEMWSNTSEPFKVTPILYDLTTKAVVYEFPTVTASTNGETTYTSTAAYAAEGDLTSPIFDNAYKQGYVGIGSQVNQYNNRYTTAVDFVLVYNDTTNATGNIAFAINIEGKSGQRIDVYAPSQYSTFASNNVAGYVDGGGEGSISDVSCAKNVISVGAYTTRTFAPVRISDSAGNRYGYNYAKYLNDQDIAPFSSYGTLVDGRKLPHLSAPGAMVISSMSPYYMTLALQQGVYESDLMVAAKTTYNSSAYYYDAMMGTSMASPFTSGVVALMLQANPNLTAFDVRDILIQTARKDDYYNNSANQVQWGAGKIDALAAVKMAIDYVGGVEGVVVDRENSVFVSNVGDNVFEVTVAGGNDVNATLYNVSGQPVVNASAHEGNVVVDASGVNAGVYILVVNSGNTKHTSKVVVK